MRASSWIWVLPVTLSHLHLNASRIFSLKRTPRRCVLAGKSARFKSPAAGPAGDLPNSDNIAPAMNPRRELIVVEKRMFGTRDWPSFGRPVRHYLCTASFSEASNSVPVLLMNSDWPNN